MSLEKFTAQEIELIEDFLNDAKNTSKNKKLDFTSLSGSLYKGSYDIPRGNAASENWGDRILSDNFKMSDRITFKILVGNEHIDTIDFSKNISKKILGKDIITIEIVRKRYLGNYGEYGLQYGGNMGVRIHYTQGGMIPSEKNIQIPEEIVNKKQLPGFPRETEYYQQKNGCGIELIKDYFGYNLDTLLADIKKI